MTRSLRLLVPVLLAVLSLQGGAASARPSATTLIEPATGITVTVTPDGDYTVAARHPAWSFAGTLGRPLSEATVVAGSDGIGAYRAIRFRAAGSTRTESIRAYAARPVVIFSISYGADASNTEPFPAFARYPQGVHHLSYSGPFGAVSFDFRGASSPWLFFDDSDDAAILSPASDFMVAQTAQDAGGVIGSGIDPSIARLPRGLTHQTILAFGTGINGTFDRWGHALTDLYHKQRPSNEAGVTLSHLGYWTDHGAAYYYHYEPALGYEGTLLAVRDEFARLGLPLGYMQLDSWWYPKGPYDAWWDNSGGAYTYTASPLLFPQGLAAFQRQLGLPLVVHARWIAQNSPYRSKYATSDGVVTDPRFWTTLAGYLGNSGVATFEQDWLDSRAVADTSIAAQDAFMDNMAHAMARDGLSVQYCRPQPRHYLQSVLYDAVQTIRVSDDRFGPNRWTDFLYASRLASALGLWPWSDVFMSNEEGNLLLATLSGGMVGVGDALGTIDAADLRQAVRPDGLIVKPDAPIVPTDATYIDDARGGRRPMVAWTYSDHGSMRAAYIVAYPRAGQHSALFRPSEMGLSGRVYVYDTLRKQGTITDSGQTVDVAIGRGGYGYAIAVPVGRSGMALLGDLGKFASLGRQRVARLSDDGAVRATVAFAQGEHAVTLTGYAPAAPRVAALSGSAGPVSYDATSHLFRVPVAPGPGSANSASVVITSTRLR